MAINFTKNIEQYTTAQRTSRVKAFMEFTSKKQLENAGVLTDEQLAFVKNIKGTFSFALHTDKRYMAITLYKASAERKYNFLIVDLQEQAIAEADSIKNAKADILDQVDEDFANTVHEMVNEHLKEQEESTTAESEEENAESEDEEQFSIEDLAKEA